MNEHSPAVVVQPKLSATVEVPAPVAWYKPVSEVAGAFSAVFAILAWIGWVVVRIANADRDIREVKHDLKNAEQKIVALDSKRETAEKTLVALQETTKALQDSIGDLKGLVTRVLDAVTTKR